MRRQHYLLFLFALPLLGAQQRLEEYALILQDQPAAREAGVRPRIQSAQQNLRHALAQRKIAVSGQAQTLLNALFVRVPRERVAELRSLAGVKHVIWLPPLKRNMNVAVNLSNVPAAWSALPGGMANAGAGIKIAIVDSGIDETHPAFQDASLSPPSGYPLGDTAYTNGKIIVARSYEPLFVLPDDGSPRDRSGHGTALAMIAAGETNTGPLATIAGVAPKAWIGNYKIFGTPGMNDNTTYAAAIQALEDAVADHMDIAVLGFGSLPLNGPLDTDTGCQQSNVPAAYTYDCDIPAQAVENAVKLGMTVVASAGNDGQSSSQPPTLNSINSPGTAPSAITVGSATNGHLLFASVKVNGSNVPSNVGIMDAVVGDGAKLTAPLTGTIKDVTSVDSSGLACSALPGGSLTESIVLIARGTCDFSTKIDNAQQAGAEAVVIYQDSLHPTDLPFGDLGARNTGIPAMMIYNASGIALKSYLASHSNTQATLDPALHVENATPNLVTQFTSRGPSIDYAIKPEVVAVGQGIYTATESLDPGGDLYDPTGYTVVQGSSFAAAMVGGAAALVKQANPGFSAAQIKSAIVNTASIGPSDISDSTQSTSNLPLVTAVGAGKLNAPAALAPGATAAPATISFGWMGPGSPASTVPLTITNTGKATATFKISVVPDPAARSARRRRRWRRRLGPHFRDYHLLLDEQGDQLFAMTDPIAERIRKIGGTTLRSIGHIARLQRVSDNDAEYVEPEDMLAELREDKKSLAARLREAHGVCEEHTDVATASLIEVWIDETERFACYRGNAVPVNSVLGLRNSSRAGRHYCGWSKCGAYQRPEHYSGRSKCGRPASTLRLAQFSGRVNMPIGA